MSKKTKAVFIALELVLSIVLVFFSLSVFGACKQAEEPDATSESESAYKATYTVTFDSNGGTLVRDQVVRTGKTAKAPDNPVKNGYFFVGWYNELTDARAFDFSTPIYSDITLHAMWRDAKDEFKVTYIVDGEEYTVGYTNKAIITDLPTPEKQGKTFAGWWTSDYNDASKLTGKYTGAMVYEDTMLYAVWKEDGIQLSVTETGATWVSTAANQSFKVTVIFDENSEDPVTVTTNKFDYDFAKADAGDYVVQVQIVGGKTYTAYFKNKALARVTKISVDENVISWEPVQGATEYYVLVDCGDEAHEHKRTSVGEAREYDFSNCEMQVGGIEFIIYASAKGFATSESAVFTVERLLDEVKNLAVNDEKATWAAVEKADQYHVEITAGETVDVYTKEPSVDLTAYTGNITVKVTPMAYGYAATATAEKTYNKAKLASPEFTFEGTELVWKEVAGAVGYRITVGNDKSDYAANVLRADLGEYVGKNITVQALAANSANDSVAVAVPEVKADIKVEYIDGVAYWNPVAGAEKYLVRVNGGEAVETKDVKAEIALTKAGNNTVEVAAVKNGTAGEWYSATVKAYEIAFKTESSLELEKLYVVEGQKYSLPVSEKKGYTFGGWYNDEHAFETYAGKINSTGYFDFGENITVYAQYVPNTYTVTLEYDDGTTEQRTVRFGRGFVFPTLETGDNTKEFAGWFSELHRQGTQYTDEAGESITGWFDFTNDVVLHPGWFEVLDYTLIENGTAWSVSKGALISKVSVVTVPVEYEGLPVKEINSFASTSSLKVLNIPDTIERVLLTLDASAFASCYYIEAVNVYPVQGNHERLYASVDGVLFYNNKESTQGVELKYYPYNRSQRPTTGDFVNPDYTIPSEVLFEDYRNTTREGATEADNVWRRVDTIPTNVFKSIRLSNITIPATISKIDKEAFASMLYLEGIVFEDTAEGEEEIVLTVGSSAFKSCSSLIEVELPARLKDFKVDMFESCSKLENVNVSEKSEVYSSKGGVVCSADGTKMLFAPKGKTGEYVIPAGVKVIGESAFEKCTKLTKITVPGFVTTIEKKAFSGCSNVEDIIFEGDEIDDALTIGDEAFYGNKKVVELTIAENVKTIGRNAFGNIGSASAKLTVNVLSEGEVNFSNAAFMTTSTGSMGTAYVGTLNIGPKTGTFDINGVAGGTNLEAVNVDEANPYYATIDGVVFDKQITEIIYYPTGKPGDYEIPETVTRIGAKVFESKTGLTKITINKNITYIGESAFKSCTNLVNVTFEEGGTEALVIERYAFQSCSKVKNITLPERTTEIGDGAFASCTVLESLYIPATVEVIGTNHATRTENGNTLDYDTVKLFDYDTALKTLVVAEGNKVYASKDNVLYLRDEETSKLTEVLATPRGAVGNIEISADVEKVWDDAFKYTNATKITFPEIKGDLYVGYQAFYYSNLEEVYFADAPEGNTVTFGSYTFYYTRTLKTVVLPGGLTSLGKYTFYYDTALKSLTIPNTVETIEAQAFQSCTALTDITFEEGGDAPLVLADGSTSGGTTGEPTYYGVFVGCTALTDVVLPERTSYIGIYAFYRLAGLRSVTIPKNTATIANYAFYYCANLKEVNFAEGSKLETIGNSAFYQTNVEEFDLPEGLKTVGTYTFAYNSSLKKIAIPASLESMGTSAFASCANLEEVTFAENGKLKVINDYAFQNDKSLKSITIPSSVETIGTSAFASALNLAELNFAPDSSIKEFKGSSFSKTAVRVVNFPISSNNITLGASMFLSCPNLEEVYLSESVINITGAFSGAAALKRIIVSENSENFSSGDGTLPIIYNKAGKIIRYAYGNIKGELHIPEGITEIDNKALENQTITKVYIPTSMQKIGQYAFAKNRFLTDVIFADDCVVNTIDTYAFVYCPKLENINLDKLYNLKAISNYTFRYDESLKEVTLPDSLTTIGQYAFAETGLTSIVIPEKVTKIDNYAFNKCYDLKSVDIQGPVATFGTYLFQNNTSLEEVNFGDDVKATDFGNYMFDGCTSLTEIEIPSTIVWFGTYTFRNSGLESIELPENMVALSNYVFQNSKLKEIKIPAKLKYIGASSKTATATTVSTTSYAFSGCTELEHVDFSDATSLALIGTYAFNGCTKLTSVDLPSQNINIGNYAFADSGINGDLVVPANVTLGTHVFLRTDIESVTIKNGATLTASNYAFAETPIKSVVIEGTNAGAVNYGLYPTTSLTSTSSYNFESDKYISGANYLSNGAWFYKCYQLEEVTLNDATTAIGNMLFAGCTSLKAIDLPASLTKIGNCAFANSGIESIEIPAGVTSLANASGTSYTASTYGAMFYQCESLKEISLPKGLVNIGAYTFDGCTALEKITYEGAPEAAAGEEVDPVRIPASVIRVGNYAFRDTGFKKITLPAKSWTTVGTYIFANSALEELVVPEGYTTLPANFLNGSENLKKVTLPSTISATGLTSALSNTGIEEITIPDKITSLPASAFKNCEKLAKVNLNKVKEIGANAFEGCVSLKSIDLSGVTAIGNYAFRGTGLTSVDVPDSVTRVGGTASTTHDGSRSNVMYVFANCASLKRVSLPEGILWIGAYNFSGCTALEEINIPSTVTVIGVGAFRDCTSLTSIEIPEGVDSISSGAFDGCGITEITVPASMADIYASTAPNPFPSGTTEPSYKNPFVNAYKLEKITVAEGNSVYMSDNDGNFYTIDGKLLSVPMGKTGKLTITATEIDSTAFFGTQATEIVIKAGVTDLANYAMAGMDKVRSVTLPEGLETIGTYAFAGSENLEKVNIPGSVAIINNFTFKGCVKLNDLTIGDGVTTIGVSSTSSNTTVFEGCDSLKTINIPESVYEIGKYAFAKWTGADTVVIDSENIVTIPQYAFQDSGVKHVVLGANIQTVEMYAFKNCDSLETVVFKGPTVISGSSAFAECDALKSVVFEDPDATITASSAFQKCTALESFTFPANMAEIPSSMFSGCTALSSVTLGENIATVGNYAFKDCLNLKSIYIPANVMTMGTGAFRNWTEEQTIYIELEDIDLPSTWFGTSYTNTSDWDAYCEAKVVYGVAPEDYVG
ncbi:MAG: leucine-rich repeat protein [Clostridia bacterium]|nr:leucine-rich repeat protein [Clostridia bacterium]